MRIPILVLAAGASTRMGRPKQTLPFAGTTLLGHILDAALGADLGPVVTVLGANADRIQGAISDLRLRCVINPEWALGMGSSIRAGLQAVLEDKSTVDGVLIILGDQPRIDAALLRQIATTALHHPDRIVAASYASTIGVPALFPEAFFKELQALDPKQGAKPLLERLHDRIVPLMIAQNPDLDTMDEYLEEAGRWPD